MDEKEEDFTSLSIVERLEHKVWKARLSACEDLTKLLAKTVEDRDFYTYEPCLKKLVIEPNAVAQEAGLAAVLEYVSNAPNASSTRETIIPALVEKCLGATKVGTKQKATDIILLYAEIDTPDPVLEFVLPGLNAKQPKLVAQTVTILKELVTQFGSKKVSPKPILKILPKLFGHSDKNVRAEASNLTIELYRWIGEPMMNSLSALKPVQIKELEEAFKKLPADRPTPTRLIRSEQAVEPEEEHVFNNEDGDNGDNQVEEMEVEEIDAFDLADPVDITAKLPGDFNTLIESKKWQERRAALDAVIEQAKVPKILDKDYSELMAALAKRINDANILLVGAAANCIELIATGLRMDFGKYKPVVTPVMIEKLKERKPAILEQLASGLNAVFASVPLLELVEDVTAASKHKNPQVRCQCFKLLSRRLREVKEMPGKVEIKTFAEMFKNLLDDADANARDAGAEGLGTMMKLIGEKPMLAFTDGLDDIKMGKIKEQCQLAVVKAKAKKAAPPPPTPIKKAAPARREPPKPKVEPMVIDEDTTTTTMNPPKRKPPARLAGASNMKKPALSSSKPKPATATAAASSGGAPKKSAKLPPPSGPEEIKYKFSPEDAEARATEFIPEAIWTALQQSQWKARLEAMESFANQMEAEAENSSVEPEIVIRCFSKKPGWKEMNFQVNSKMYSIIQILATNSPKFSKACGAICIPTMVEKLGDIKLKKPAGDCLIAIAEKISLQFVFGQAYSILKKAKSPKVLSDSLLWIHSCLMDFGIGGLQIRDLIDLIKFGLTNTNASVRTSSVTVLGALRQYIGPDVKSFVEDVSPALLAIIEQEFDKVSQMDPPQPTKGATTLSAGRDGGGSGGTDDSTSNDAIESLFPRVDISSPLTKTVAECNDANWKIRKEGLDKVMSIIAGSNNRIKPNLGTEFPGALKLRLNDSNKNLQVNAVEIAGLLATAMGKPFDKYIRTFIVPVTAVLSDNKANVRAAGVATLESFRKACSMDPMAASFGTSLETDSPMLRKELLTWFSTAIRDEPNAVSYDFTGMISPLFSCLQDRSADVRKASQSALPPLISAAGYDTVYNKLSELKPAARQTVLPLLEAAKGLAPATPVPASAVLPKRSTAASSRPESMHLSDDHAKAPTVPASPSRMKTLSGRKKIGIPAPKSTSTAQAPSEESSAPVLSNDVRAKQIRAKKENRWQFDQPRPDLIEGLKALFDSNFSPEAISLLFSNSQYAERDHLSGMTLLNECISSPDMCTQKYGTDFADMKLRYVANADLVLKYVTIRLFDTNTSMLIKCLDLTQSLVAVMDEEGYHLTEYEAISFLPYLINKIGDPKETMRARIRSILKSLCRIYPASKVFNYLLDSTAASKNAKARAECLDEIGDLIQRNGVSVMLPNKALPLIAVHIGDRDAGVRKAALNGIAQAYILIGDAVMKYMTKLGDKEKDMLEERLKRTKPSAGVLAAAEKEQRARQEAEDMEIDELPSISNLPRLGGRSQIGRPRANIVSPQRSIHHVQNTIPEPEPMEDVTDDYGQRIGHYQQPPPQQQQQQRQQGGYYQQTAQPVAQQSFEQEGVVDYLISQITSGDPQPSIEALKNLDKFLAQKPEAILPDIEQLINAITLQVRLVYTSIDSRQPATTRLCKHLVNALVLLFSNKDLACAVPQDALHHLLQELAHRLLDQKMLALESGPQLSKALNVAMVKVLENSSRNVTFSALLSILGNCSAGLRPGDSATAKDTKYTELIMKCLWKLAKTIQDNLRSGILNADELLFEINQFFVVTPPSEWKRRATENVPLGEMPLRTVKTLLLELVNGLGESIFQHLTLLENPQRSSVYPYLHHMLEACRKKERQQNMQHPPVQPQQAVTPASSAEEGGPNRFSHSRNSSIGRPASISSLKSNPTIRSPSINSYSSNGAAPIVPTDNNHVDNYGDSPQVQSSPVQPMQIDEPPQSEAVSNINNNDNHTQTAISDYDLNVALTQIFKKIGSRDQTKQGIIELYEFQKKYPPAVAKVNSYLSQTGGHFHSYIRRGLKNLENEDNEITQAAQYAQQTQEGSPKTDYRSYPSTPTLTSNFNNPETASSATRTSYEPQTQQRDSNRSSFYAGDDTAEIKLRLLKLQQKFGFRAENEENSIAQGISSTLDPSTSSNSTLNRQDISPTYSYTSRRQSGMNQDASTTSETDRQPAVSALKERLAKMRQLIDKNTASADL